MPRKPKDTKAAEDAKAAEETNKDLADLDARPETNEGNESAMAGREATDEDRKGAGDSDPGS
jgi:hypothetical protein